MSPVYWRVSTQAALLRGTAENVSIDADGYLRLAPSSDTVYEASAPFLWSGARVGEALWVGSGNDGEVYRVGPDGTTTTVFDAGELHVHALAPRGEQSVYVGTSPDGAVFEVAADGTSAPVRFDPEERYVWAIARDSATGTFYVGTGDPGRIYRVPEPGEADVFYDTGSTHVLSLVMAPDGQLLAGTGSPGRVFRIAPDGQAFVLLDLPESEVRSLRVTDSGTLYAVAVRPMASASQQPSNATSTSVSSQSANVTVTTTTTTSSSPAAAGTSPAGTASNGGGAVYRIEPDGVWDLVWESSEDTPYDVLPLPPDASSPDTLGGVLIGTGDGGKLFQVTERPRRVVLLSQADAHQITAFIDGRDGVRYYLTANPGKIHRLSPERAARGAYVSAVRDAGTVATWGTVSWRATVPANGTVELFTRTGNTAEPGSTWSPWSSSYRESTGSPITSPKARYIQWKAELSGTDSPALMSVTTSYLPRNQAPAFTALTVHEPGIVFQQPFSSTDPPIAGLEAPVGAGGRGSNASNGDALGRQIFRKGLQSFVWSASDSNGDDLTFDLYYRDETSLTWRTLATGILESIYTWDTSTTPDGTYLIRVVASDHRSNAPGQALTRAIESTPFDVDNSPPTIDVEPVDDAGDRLVIPVTVRDTHSPIVRLEYSRDMVEWQVVYPLDGIADSTRERFEITAAPSDTLQLVIRAWDALGNTATARAP